MSRVGNGSIVITTPRSTERLGLSSILTNSLPLTLMTDSAPERYVIEAVFTRRVDPDEVAFLLGAQTREFLDERGYPEVQLTVSDRRLVIANTNLEELRDGLASDIAELLTWISEQVRVLHHEQDTRREDETNRLRERTEAIFHLAQSISFEPSQRQRAPRSGRADERAIGQWDSEGGASAVKERSSAGGHQPPERSAPPDQP